jgi:hypothetical protein
VPGHLTVYILKRFWLVLPLAAAAIAVAGACALGVSRLMASLAGTPVQPWLKMPGFILIALTFLGAVMSQLFVVFSWLEQRAVRGDFSRADREARFCAAFALTSAFVALPMLLLAVSFRSFPAILAAIGVVAALICFIYDAHGSGE